MGKGEKKTTATQRTAKEKTKKTDSRGVGASTITNGGFRGWSPLGSLGSSLPSSGREKRSCLVARAGEGGLELVSTPCTDTQAVLLLSTPSHTQPSEVMGFVMGANSILVGVPPTGSWSLVFLSLPLSVAASCGTVGPKPSVQLTSGQEWTFPHQASSNTASLSELCCPRAV